MPRLAAYGKNINAFRHAGRGVFSGRITAREGKNAETDKQKEENRYKSIENGIQIQKKEKGKEQQSKAEKSTSSYGCFADCYYSGLLEPVKLCR